MRLLVADRRQQSPVHVVGLGSLLEQGQQVGQTLTHLAQVAVRADHQLKVLKQRETDSTQLSTRLLTESDRVDEIARMLGGTLSDQSRAHAEQMLAGAQQTIQ